VGSFVVTKEGAQHAIGEDDVIVKPCGKKRGERLCGFGVAGFNEECIALHLAAGSVVLPFVPRQGLILAGAHQPLFVGEVFFGADEQTVEGLLNTGEWSLGIDGLLQLDGRLVDGVVLPVDLGQEDAVCLAPRRHH